MAQTKPNSNEVINWVCKAGIVYFVGSAIAGAIKRRREQNPQGAQGVGGTRSDQERAAMLASTKINSLYYVSNHIDLEKLRDCMDIVDGSMGITLRQVSRDLYEQIKNLYCEYYYNKYGIRAEDVLNAITENGYGIEDIARAISTYNMYDLYWHKIPVPMKKKNR